MGILRLLAWWLGGERPLRTRPPHPVGTIIRPLGHRHRLSGDPAGHRAGRDLGLEPGNGRL